MNIKQIHVVAPSNSTPDIEDVLKQFSELAAGRNIDVVYSPQLTANHDYAWYSAPFEIREQNFYDALTDDKSQVIWAMRGGSGAAELLASPRICDAIRTTNKVLIGFSDITSLHLTFNYYSHVSIHGPVVSSVIKHPESFAEVIDILQNKPMQYVLTPLNITPQKSQVIGGTLLGGNLAVYHSMLSTPFMPDINGKILMFEDVNEPGYKLMRLFTQLQLNGTLADCKALLLGEFTNSDQYRDFAFENILDRFLVNIPVYKINHIGHVLSNRPIPLGGRIHINNNQLISNHIF